MYSINFSEATEILSVKICRKIKIMVEIKPANAECAAGAKKFLLRFHYFQSIFSRLTQKNYETCLTFASKYVQYSGAQL